MSIELPPELPQKLALPARLVYRGGPWSAELDSSFWTFLRLGYWRRALGFGLSLAVITGLLWRFTAWQVTAIRRRGKDPPVPLASWERAVLIAGSLLLTAPAAAFAGMVIAVLCIHPHH